MTDKQWIVGTLGVCAVGTAVVLGWFFWPEQMAATPVAATTIAATQPAATRLASSPPPIPVAPIVPSLPKPPPQTVRGGAWIKRNDGGSDLLRGLRIVSLPASVRTDAVKAFSRKLLQSEQVAAKRYTDFKVPSARKDIANAKAKVTASLTENIALLSKVSETSADRTDPLSLLAVAEKVRAGHNMTYPGMLEFNPPYEKMMTGEYDRWIAETRDFDSLGAKLAPEPFDFRLIDAMAVDGLVSVKTSIDGRYELKDPTGQSKYLLAFIDSPSIGILWIVPIPLAGGDITIDFDNDNAVRIDNKK